MSDSNVTRFAPRGAPAPPARGKVSLVGAGPGDPGLLTVKAARLLAECDVVVYDDLVNPAVLMHARCGAELVSAGRRAGGRGVPQEDVTRLLVERGLLGQRVVRLKGGDPFVFGRGGEEAGALAAAGVEWEVVPGVTSAVAAPAYAGVPLTFRGVASSVAFIAGHGPAGGEDPVDWDGLARAADTLVVFMCGRTAPAVARRLLAAGRELRTPAALVHRGTCADQEVFAGTLGELAAHDATGPFDGPVLAVIGDVVGLRDQLRWFGDPAAERTFGEARSEPAPEEERIDADIAADARYAVR
jgi:uroporphyrinogen III methyltransferase / synthase